MSEQSFEQELEKLAVCVEALSQPNIPLNESLDNFEKGVALFRECQNLLDHAKQKVITLKADPETPIKPAENFEYSLKQLEGCVEQLGDADVSLNEALMNFEKGVTLFRACQEHLNQSKQKVMELKLVGGSIQETPKQK